MRFLLTLLPGPVAAFLPARWRSALPLAGAVNWERAAAISGLCELVGALVALGFWYMRCMGSIISAGTESAMNGRFGGVEVTEHQLSGAALFIFYFHPLTWLLAFIFAEGAVRLLAAFIAEDARGSLPLYLLERGAHLAAHPDRTREVADDVRENFRATLEAFREWVMVKRTEEVTDEHVPFGEGGEQYLEINSSRRKDGWEPPKIVRVDEVYYRLEDAAVDKASRTRPFRYRLRRLEAGVPGKNVIIYRRPIPGAGP